jgi:hypothetical protein
MKKFTTSITLSAVIPNPNTLFGSKESGRTESIKERKFLEK